MDKIFTFFNSNLFSAVLSSVIAVVGVWLSHRLAVNKTQKAMEIYKSELTKRIYASSKRSDMEYETFYKLGKICGDIHLIMERFYPDKMSLHQINTVKKPTFEELAAKIHELDVELNIHRAFIPKAIVSSFEELIETADQFFVCAESHIDCWDETNEDRKKKEERKNTAYEKRLSFDSKWKATSINAMEYLQSKELV